MPDPTDAKPAEEQAPDNAAAQPAGAAPETPAEPTTDAEAEQLFSAASKPAAKPKPAKPAAAQPSADQKPGKPAAGDETPAGEETAGDKPPQTAKAQAEARAAEIEREEREKTVAAEADRIQKAKAAADDAAKKAPAAAAGVDMKQVESIIRQDLSDLKIPVTVDGKAVELSLADFESDEKGYGEAARGSHQFAVAAAFRIAQRMVAPIWEQLNSIRAERAKEVENAAHEKFIGKIEADTAHKDIREIEASDAYWAWLDKQSDGIKKLADSDNLKDLDFVLRAFKEETGWKSAGGGKPERTRADLEAEQRGRSARSGALHRSTLQGGGGPGVGRAGEGLSEEDAQKVFQEAASGAGG